jgi:putative nucleotidyltransferase-like protein
VTGASRTRLGRLVAGALSSAWQASPPPLALAAGELSEIAPILLGAGAGGLGWGRVRGTGLESTPAGQAFHQAHRHQALDYLLRSTRIAEVVQHLRRAGIEPLMGKGWGVASLYREPGLRPCGDIDLYVGRQDHAAAALALGGEVGELVDLHCGFAELDDRQEEELRARSRLSPAGQGTVRIFGPEDHLRLIALHALRHGLLRPLWLCDVAVVLESAGEGFDWEYFAGGRARRAEWALVALEVAREILGARRESGGPGPHRVRLPSWVVPAVLQEWGAARPPHGSRVPVSDLLRRPTAWWGALRLRWPNAIEATIGLGSRFNELPRLPLQIGECVRRTLRFAVRRLPEAATPAGHRG